MKSRQYSEHETHYSADLSIHDLDSEGRFVAQSPELIEFKRAVEITKKKGRFESERNITQGSIIS